MALFLRDKTHFYVDESGDPFFYKKGGRFIVGQPGCSRVLILGFIAVRDPNKVRAPLIDLRNHIARDEYLSAIPSLSKSLQAFHAKDDCPEVRERTFKLIRELPVEAHFIVARKRENIFRKSHKGRPDAFYDDIVTRLFQDHLHKSKENLITFASRGHRSRTEPLRVALERAALKYNKKSKKTATDANRQTVFSQTPKGEPILSVIDYMNWALYRAYERRDMRYFNFMRNKVGCVCDIFDSDNWPRVWYARKRNPFDIEKTSPL